MSGDTAVDPELMTSPISAAERRSRRRAWITVFGGCGVQVLISAVLTQSFGGYVVLLRDEFGWSSTLLSGAYAMLRLESNLLGPVQGWITDRFGPRRVMALGVVLMGIGFVAFSRIETALQFFGAFLVIAIGASFAGWLTLATAIVRIFTSRRSLPMSVAKIGVGLGGLAAPLVLGMLATYGWRTTAMVSGIVITVGGLLFVPVIQGKGRYVPQAAAVDPETGEVSTTREVHYSARQALRTPAFWLISLGHACAVMVVATLIVQLVPYLTDTLGYSLGAASLVVAALTLAQLLGTLVGGYFGDGKDRRLILAGTMLMHGTGVLMLTYARNITMVVAFIVLHGVAWGVRAPLQQSLRADYFGAASFGTILGFSSLLVTLGNSGGPLLGGYLIDSTGGYRPAFTAMGLVAIAGSTFFFFARRPRPLPDDSAAQPTNRGSQPNN